MNNMIMLQHTEIKASFETSAHVVGHVSKVTLYKRLLGMVSRYVLNQIVAEFERVHYAGKNPSSCGCIMRTTHGLPCACELSKYVLGSIPLNSIHMFWKRLSFCLIAVVLGMGEDSWSLVRNHLLKELGKWSDDYIRLFGGTGRFEELRRSLLVDGLSMVSNLYFVF